MISFRNFTLAVVEDLLAERTPKEKQQQCTKPNLAVKTTETNNKGALYITVTSVQRCQVFVSGSASLDTITNKYFCHFLLFSFVLSPSGAVYFNISLVSFFLYYRHLFSCILNKRLAELIVLISNTNCKIAKMAVNGNLQPIC